MANFFDQFDDTPAQPSVSPVQRAFLNSMSAGESPNYNTMYGGGRFEELNDHPRQNIPIRSGPNAGRTSSAAGKYQFLQGTWDEAKNALGLPDFSPESQDKAALWLAERDYKKRTGRDFFADLEASKDNPAKLNFHAGALGGTWTSLPGGIEPNRATHGFGQRMVSELSSQNRQPTANFFDQFDAPSQATPQAPQAAPQVPLPRPAPADTFNQRFGGMDVTPAMRLAVEQQNQQIAGGQGTTPIMDLQQKNLISDIVHESDAGTVMFRDPQTGQMVEADKNKHVTLRDPQDNRLKVYARTESTNENPMVSASRVLAQGMAAGAPTARAAIPAVAAVKTPAPTTQQLKSAAKEGFESFRQSDIALPAPQMKEFGRSVAAELNADGFYDVLAPKAFGVLSKLDGAADDAAMTAGQMHAFRRAIGKVAGSADETERAAAVAIRERFDELLGTLPGNDETLKPALGNYAAAKRSEQVTGAAEKADLQAASTGSGANIDNAMRQQIKALLNNPKKLRGFSGEEISQMRQVVQGTFTGNTARLVGKLAPTGIVSGSLSGGAGFVAGGGIGAVAVPLAGAAAKKFADTLTASQMNKLDELIRSRSPLAKQVESSLKAWEGKVNDLADVPNAPKVAQVALATRNLVNNLKDAGITLSPGDFMKALSGTIAGRTEDE
jgi:muramidase (phage lysozyme)